MKLSQPNRGKARDLNKDAEQTYNRQEKESQPVFKPKYIDKRKRIANLPLQVSGHENLKDLLIKSVPATRHSQEPSTKDILRTNVHYQEVLEVNRKIGAAIQIARENLLLQKNSRAEASQKFGESIACISMILGSVLHGEQAYETGQQALKAAQEKIGGLLATLGKCSS